MGDELDVRLLPASVSPLLAADVAAAPRPCRVLAAFTTCAYVALGGHDRVLALLAADALALPIGLHLTARSEELAWEVEAGDEVVVGAGRVRLPRVEIVASRIRRPERVRPAAWHGSWPTDGGVLADLAHQVAAEALAGRPVGAGVGGLVGAGSGLTPSGDDVLCGVLLTLGAVDLPQARSALSAVRSAVAGRLTATTSLSAALLVAAGAGYAVPDVVRLVTLAVGSGDSPPVPADPPVTADPSAPGTPADVGSPDVEEVLGRVLAIGHSSGRDLVSGVVGTLRALDDLLDPTQEGARRG